MKFQERKQKKEVEGVDLTMKSYSIATIIEL